MLAFCKKVANRCNDEEELDARIDGYDMSLFGKLVDYMALLSKLKDYNLYTQEHAIRMINSELAHASFSLEVRFLSYFRNQDFSKFTNLKDLMCEFESLAGNYCRSCNSMHEREPLLLYRHFLYSINTLHLSFPLSTDDTEEINAIISLFTKHLDNHFSFEEFFTFV